MHRLAPLSLFALCCCSGQEETLVPTGPTVQDTRYHAPPNGERVSENAACEKAKQAYKEKLEECQGGTTTTRPCPEFLRAQQGGTACLQYDQGSAQGCAEFFAQEVTCADLVEDSCVVYVYAGSAPAGCP
ncbi:MAG: hypothetical protein HY744_18280 [Deltaproteobacteria bacterium]|nr:hypothetical protein [Deltaproteobacteria bacterium]